MSILKLIIQRQVWLENRGIRPVSIQQWEKDDDGLMYANSLLEQIEDTVKDEDSL